MSALLVNLLHFGRLLHRAGLDVPAGSMRYVAEALPHINLGSRSEFYYALRTLIVHRFQDLSLFDNAFNVFWEQSQEANTPHNFRDRETTKRPDQDERNRPRPKNTPDNQSSARHSSLIEQVATLSYSENEGLWTKDFDRFTDAEVNEAHRIMTTLDWGLGQRISRRWTSGHGPALDLRRIVRRNMRYGGELIELPSRTRKTKKRPLILICDISGSMERYSRMLLHFTHTLSSSGRVGSVESFVFATQLTRITHQLIAKPVGDVVPTLPQSITDFGSGTRIGAALRTFNTVWARRVRSQGPIVLLISDGWDRGDPEVLRAEMLRLSRSCYRLIWLNPLLGAPDYLPLTRGMQAALPAIDDFLPVHNLKSLEALAKHLNTLPARRSAPFKFGYNHSAARDRVSL